VKAIETTYKGYRFRSRLEARWAVFFDAYGIRWKYEVEGYESDDGVRYLPDFWCPDFSCFFEIKPLPDFSDNELRKVKVLMDKGEDVYILAGNPWPWEYVTFFATVVRGEKMLFPSPTSQFAKCRKCGGVALNVSSIDGSQGFGFHELHTTNEKCEHVWWWDRHEKHPSNVHRAYTAARSARFEHGEVPA
jgi:hypothetical protein